MANETDVMKQEANDNQMTAEAEEILINGYRALMFAGQKVYVRHPNLKEQSMLQKDYAIRFAKSIKEPDIMTRRQMVKELEKKEIWSHKDDERIEELRKTYSEYHKEWYSVPYEDRIDNAEFEKLSKLYMKSMQDYIIAYTEREALFAGTVEKMIETEQIVKKIYNCVVKNPETDEKFFASEEAVEKYPDGDAMSRLISDCSNFWIGISERFLEQLPGNMNGKDATK